MTLWQCRPLTGARIETPRRRPRHLPPRVAPSRGRELKHSLPFAFCEADGVAPSRGRELKQQAYLQTVFNAGRPLTGARIETLLVELGHDAASGRPLTGARIETFRMRSRTATSTVAPSRGRELKLTLCNGIHTA